MAPASSHPGKIIKSKRLERGWSVEDLASKSKLGFHSIEAIERGRRNPSRPTLWALSQAFECQPEDLKPPAEGVAA